MFSRILSRDAGKTLHPALSESIQKITRRVNEIHSENKRKSQPIVVVPPIMVGCVGGLCLFSICFKWTFADTSYIDKL